MYLSTFSILRNLYSKALETVSINRPLLGHVQCSLIIFQCHFCLGHPSDDTYPNSFATKLPKLHDISAFFYDMVDKLHHLDILLQLQGELFEDTLKEAAGSIS